MQWRFTIYGRMKGTVVKYRAEWGDPALWEDDKINLRVLGCLLRSDVTLAGLVSHAFGTSQNGSVGLGSGKEVESREGTEQKTNRCSKRRSSNLERASLIETLHYFHWFLSGIPSFEKGTSKDPQKRSPLLIPYLHGNCIQIPYDKHTFRHTPPRLLYFGVPPCSGLK